MAGPSGARRGFAYVVGDLGPGGLERQLFHLITGVREREYPVSVFVWDLDPSAHFVDSLEDRGVSVRGLSQSSRSRKLIELRRAVGELAPALVHSYSFFTNFAAWFAVAGRPGIAIGSLRTNYAYERRLAGPLVGRLSSRFPRTLVANSFAARDAAAAERGPWSPRNIEVVLNAVDVTRFQSRAWQHDGPFEILGVGRLFPQKAWDVALRALAAFDSFAPGEWRFRLAGAGPLEAELRSLAAKLGIAARVHFLGVRSDVPELLAESHALLLSSIHEGTPNVVLEAMAAGRPAVATACGDVPRLVKDGVTGFVVPTGDARALGERLAKLAANRDEARRLGEAARREVEKENTPEALAAAVLEAYRRAGWRD